MNGTNPATSKIRATNSAVAAKAKAKVKTKAKAKATARHRWD
jgi:hypothetical protein